ncbi:hypothetical protein [Microvirga sp. 2TAF3]|uniref:hypothetical protein n=1 Tax=Microvirga sp. 2TAF3 TaxID=3233014 RepID=UPI003F9D9841
MTLLITVAGRDFALACSDLRITAEINKRIVIQDEHFNKHILFARDNLNANISFTGVARWRRGLQTINLYDVISESLARAPAGIKLGPLCIHLIDDIEVAFQAPVFRGVDKWLELHLLSRHSAIGVPMIMVISNYRKVAPWSQSGSEDALEWEGAHKGYNIYFKVFADDTDVIFGGSDQFVPDADRTRIKGIVSRGADAFDVSRLASAIIKAAARRTSVIGSQAVSMVFPESGYIDTNLWNRTANSIIGFVPRMVMPNGTMMGPSQFPVQLALITDGYLPRHSLFFRSIVQDAFPRRRDRRLIRRHSKGLAIPGLMGLLSLNLFGQVEDGYTDFGLNSSG